MVVWFVDRDRPNGYQISVATVDYKQGSVFLLLGKEGRKSWKPPSFEVATVLWTLLLLVNVCSGQFSSVETIAGSYCYIDRPANICTDGWKCSLLQCFLFLFVSYIFDVEWRGLCLCSFGSPPFLHTTTLPFLRLILKMLSASCLYETVLIVSSALTKLAEHAFLPSFLSSLKLLK